jgi:hypothetical protein
MCLYHVSSIFKKISPKTFGPHCVIRQSASRPHLALNAFHYRYEGI